MQPLSRQSIPPTNTPATKRNNRSTKWRAAKHKDSLPIPVLSPRVQVGKKENTAENKNTLQSIQPAQPRIVAAPAGPAAKSECHLLTLPREIRDIIFSYVFGEGAIVTLGPFRRWMEPRDRDATMCADKDGNQSLRIYENGCKQLQSRILQPKIWYTPLSPMRSTQNLPSDHDKACDLTNFQGPVFPTLPLIICSKGQQKNKTNQQTKNPSKNEQNNSSKTQPKGWNEKKRKDVKSFGKKQSPTGKKQTIAICKPKWSTNTALLFVCRLTNAEFAGILYANSVFAFGCRRRISDFTDELQSTIDHAYPIPKKLPVTTENLKSIRFVSIDCRSEGLSILLDQKFRQRLSYKAWECCNRTIATRMTNLTDLTLYIEVPWAGPYELSLRSIWAKPFLAFSESTSLKRVSINIVIEDEYRFDVDRLALVAFAEIMRRKILGWDHASALETISQYKERYPKHAKTWSKLERWNADEV